MENKLVKGFFRSEARLGTIAYFHCKAILMYSGFKGSAITDTGDLMFQASQVICYWSKQFLFAPERLGLVVTCSGSDNFISVLVDRASGGGSELTLFLALLLDLGDLLALCRRRRYFHTQNDVSNLRLGQWCYVYTGIVGRYDIIRTCSFYRLIKMKITLQNIFPKLTFTEFAM